MEGAVRNRIRQAALAWGKYRRILRYAAPGRKGWALIAGMMLLTSAFGLLQPWPMKVVVDHVLGREPMPGPLAWAAGLLPGGATPRGLLFGMALAGLGVFAVNGAGDGVLTGT